MASRIEQVLWPNVQGLAKELEQVYSLIGMLSAGLLMFSKLSPQERENAIREVKKYDSKIESLAESALAGEEKSGHKKSVKTVKSG